MSFPEGTTPRTITVAGDGSQTLSYTLPAGVTLKLESILAEVTGAAGTEKPLLTIEAPGGAVIAAKRQASAIDAGSGNRATWALRLDDEAAAATPAAGGTEVGFYRHDGIYTFNASPKQLGLDLAGTSDATIFSENGTYARFTPGVYLLHAHLQFDSGVTFTGGGGTVSFALTLPAFPNWEDQFMGQIVAFDPATTIRIRTMEFQAIIATDDASFDVRLNLSGAAAGQGITEFGLDIMRLRDFDFVIT